MARGGIVLQPWRGRKQTWCVGRAERRRRSRLLVCVVLVCVVLFGVVLFGVVLVCVVLVCVVLVCVLVCGVGR